MSCVGFVSIVVPYRATTFGKPVRETSPSFIDKQLPTYIATDGTNDVCECSRKLFRISNSRVDTEVNRIHQNVQLHTSFVRIG